MEVFYQMGEPSYHFKWAPPVTTIAKSDPTAIVTRLTSRIVTSLPTCVSFPARVLPLPSLQRM
jgi:hypothetical protein